MEEIMEVPEMTALFVVPPGHLCSICSQPMLDPVCTQVGHTYDRECIQRWFQSGRQSNPCDNQVLTSTVLVDNIALRQAVESWLSDLEPFRSSPRESWDVLIKRYDWEERSARSHNPRLADVGPSTPSVPLRNNGTGLKKRYIAVDPRDAEDQNELGWRYVNGEGVEKDLAKAYGWYRKSAEQGSSRGQCNLAWCYAQGQGVAQNRAEAFKWFEKSAEQGDTLGQYNLGVFYERGWWVPKNLAKAFEWYQKSAEQGDAYGQNSLGGCYERGWGVSKDLVEAFMWYQKSAKQGDALGQHSLALCYANGWGVSKDRAESCNWYQKSAEQGYALAQYHLGMRYEFGDGVWKDVAKAEQWYRKARDNGKVVDGERTPLQEKVFGNGHS